MMAKTQSASSAPDELESARQSINQLDESIVDLLTKRFEQAADIGKIKKQRGLPVFDASREETVLQRVTSYHPNQETKQYIWNIYRSIMENTRDYEKHQHE
ncbi:chorismate mutase [Lentilactobacillus parafarraginis]|nr:chorismate mutase [Lentilactobacillus parafarraginis]